MKDFKSSLAIFLPAIGCLAPGLVGVTIGRTYAAALSTSPSWLGPAVLVGSLALVLMGVLLLPAAFRSLRRGGRAA